jgi:toxin YhaV
MSAAAPPAPLVLNGWSIYAHPLFCDQIEALIAEVDALKEKHPDTYGSKNATKRLAAISKIIFENIPSDPTRAEYRQGETLGASNKHWFRAQFFQRYRLFFRYHAATKIIVLAWVNDESTLREYESKDDAYRVFRKMLARGRPPTNWDQLLAEAQTPDSRARLQGIYTDVPVPPSR